MAGRPYRQFNNAHQPVQQQLYSTAIHHQMPYNNFYQHTTQANENNIYSARSMAMYGNNGANNEAANNAYPNNRFNPNPNASVFIPRNFVQPQGQTPQVVATTSPLTSYSNPYATYMQPQAITQPQVPSFFYAPQQQHSAIQPQQQKYQQVQMSQNSQPGYMSAQEMMAAVYQNGVVNDFQASQQQQQVAQNDPAFSTQYSQFPISTELSDAIQSSNNKMAIVEVQIGLEQLTTEPQEFDLWAHAIKARVASGVSKDDAELIAWLIVEMSFLGTNAQYSFSRLCKLLDYEIKNFTVQFVIPRIAYFMGSNSVGALSAEHLSNFITFLAELYDKTEVNGVRISRLGQYIIDQIIIQLGGNKLNDQIVKNIVQVLKLIGRHIEEDQDPEQLKQVFDKLDSLQKQCTDISSAVKNNIRQLNLLRERNWGVTKNEDFMNGSSSTNGSQYQNDQSDSGAILYGPDGKPISEEERLFLEESCRDIEQNYPGEMDADALNDYENFLQEQTQELAFSVAGRLSID